MLNDQTMKWLGQEIDKDTTGTLAGLFNRDFRVSAYTVPAGSTLVAELNNIAGGIVNGLLKNYNGWVSGDNSKLTDNVVADTFSKRPALTSSRIGRSTSQQPKRSTQ